MDMRLLDKDLDLIGGIVGTDKSSSGHNYLVHYHNLFRDHIESSFNFLEIGIFRGASLAMWRRYFERATIIGVDVKEECRRYADNGIVVEIGSQDDPGFLADLVRRYPPRIVIDDGSHLAHHVLFTFETLFPVIEPGGIYVVEDLHFHAGAMRDHSRGHSDADPIDYFLALSRMIISNELEESKRWGFRGYAHRTIDEIVFFGHGAAIKKKPAPANLTERAAAATEIAKRSGTVEAWERLSLFLASNGDRSGSISAVRNAIGIDPLSRLYLRLSLLQAESGDRHAALEAAKTSIDKAGDSSQRGECLEHYGNLLVAERRMDDAVITFKEAVQLVSHPVVRDRIAAKICQHGG